jgi:hypothetical protein
VGEIFAPEGEGNAHVRPRGMCATT